MNLGLSDIIKANFNNLTPVKRPIILTPSNNNIDPNWIAGFTTGEENFLVVIGNSKTKIGHWVGLRFTITQHEREKILLEFLMKYLKSGKLSKRTSGPVYDLRINKFSDIQDIIIPFFEKHPIQGIKHLDYLDFCKIAELINNKKHLTNEGLDEIRKIKSRTNTNRNKNSPLNN